MVGVDPGTTLGLAALDLDGQLLLLTSGKNLSKHDVLSILFGIGVPVLVASDRVIAPHAVSDIAASLGAAVFLPPQEATAKEKKRLVEDSSDRLEAYAADEHQTAALYAALRAFAHYKDLFKEAEAMVLEELKKRGPQMADEVKILAIRGVPLSRGISAVLEDRDVDLTDQRVLRASKKEIESAKEQISSLRAKLSEARSEIKGLRAVRPRREEKFTVSVELQEAQEKLRRALHEIESLKKRVEPYRLEADSWVRLCPIGSLSPSSIKAALAEGTLGTGRIAYAIRAKGDIGRCVSALTSAGVRVLVLESLDPSLEKGLLRAGVMVLRGADLPLEWRHGVPWIRESDLEKALKRPQKDLDALRRENVRDMIESYREERKRGDVS
jgi:hypothetical protein